jgi:DNA-binding transcriptional LysR family regulator
MGKAQSAISTAIANLEIDAGVDLFDRQGRNPVLTEEGKALLEHARGILLGNQEFFAKASSMAIGTETGLCFAVEQGISIGPLMQMMHAFSADFPHVTLEILRPGPNDTAYLLKEGRADLGLMIEQESYPQGFQFSGVGHSKLVPVCASSHPLSTCAQVGFHDLRQYRQLIARSRSLDAVGHRGERIGTSVWYAESPEVIAEFVVQGLGWAELPYSVVSDLIEAAKLTTLSYAFQQSDHLEGIDVVWTDQKALGVAGHWMKDHLLALPQDLWREM